jgi:cyclohexa-1,5-dienecarbonyl-CoA hydratase
MERRDMSLLGTQISDGIATLTLRHPPLNILTRALLAELREELARLGAVPDLRVLLLAAEGRHFSAGADVGEHLPPTYRELIPEVAGTMERLAAFPLPVIAAVRGRCLGGGFELVQAADMIVAGEGATFGQPEIALAVTAPIACVLLPRRTTPGAAAELLFTGDPITARRAFELGLVQRVVPDERAETEAAELATRCARHSAAALRATKRTLCETAAAPRAEALRAAARLYVNDLMRAEDPAEGLGAFLDKRSPVWRHR